MRHADIGTTMKYGDPAAADMRQANEKVVQLVMSTDELISE